VVAGKKNEEKKRCKNRQSIQRVGRYIEGAIGNPRLKSTRGIMVKIRDNSEQFKNVYRGGKEMTQKEKRVSSEPQMKKTSSGGVCPIKDQIQGREVHEKNDCKTTNGRNFTDLTYLLERRGKRDNNNNGRGKEMGNKAPKQKVIS